MSPRTSKQIHRLRLRHDQRGLSAATAVFVIAVWCGILALIFANRQNIIDWWRLRQYTPSQTIAQIAHDDTMTAYAKKVFYVNHPQIDSKDTFAPLCPKGTEQTVVLGCYHSTQDGIFILKVTDPRLRGVEQVTAAHETLHAIYDRLSAAQRRQVDAWLLDFYNKGLDDTTVRQQISDYRKSEPDDLLNEMHSLFGTEISKLPPQLEHYYSQYFSDRQAIIKAYDNYEAEFTSRQKAIKAYDAQLKALKARINADEADLKRKQASIDIQRRKLESQKSSGDINGYNAAVPSFNSLVDSYNAEVATVKQLVNEYNQVVDKRNAIALEEQQLVNDLSANPSPIAQ